MYSPLLLLDTFYIFFQANNCPFLNFKVRPLFFDDSQKLFLVMNFA